ncbi:hypothetical protein MSPP1_001162 [Malassezia sp. CBS 17886]|nr:hypothetical protein MSPP1_001162 [Malassezia sp. CBS 17886]
MTQASCRRPPLQVSEYKRYGRQLILPEFGVGAQLSLKAARVLVVGAGGLGCPAVQYLAAAGVGHLTVVDADDIETSNLARQVLHTDARVGVNKAESVREAVLTLNPHVEVAPVRDAVTAQNVRGLVRAHDVVLDCTDNVMTRYLLSDAAVLCGTPVVSAAAQGLEGHITVLHKDLGDGCRGPCYRCLFPSAPRPEHTTSCDDGGILGVVTGLVGTMQAAETIKLLAHMPGSQAAPTMVFVAPFSAPPFRSVRLRGRQASCRACGDGSVSAPVCVDAEDYRTFCGLDADAPAGDVPQWPAAALRAGIPPPRILLDVRPAHEYAITALPASLNVPVDRIRADPSAVLTALPGMDVDEGVQQVLVLCRRGQDSRAAARLLQAAEAQSRIPGRRRRAFMNVTGGLEAYARANPLFPMY